MPLQTIRSLTGRGQVACKRLMAWPIRYARWEPLLRPSKGSVIILHGRTECIEKYFETITDLRERGFGVLTFDWRGQGGFHPVVERPEKKGMWKTSMNT